MNRVTVMGRLVRDIDIATTKNDKVIGRTVLAVRSENGGEDQFFPVVLFGKTAENTAKFVQKGGRILIEGSVNYQSVKQDDDSYKNYFSIAGQKVEFIDFVNNDDSDLEDDDQAQKPKKQTKKPAKKAAAPVEDDEDEFEDMDEFDEIPF